MDFTREPVIETIITPREGYKIVLRNSKAIGQEEYFLEVVEVVSFGHALFFRSLEKPKSFLLPVADYELLEVRETRMVLKHGTAEKSIKIAGGKEAAPKVTKTATAAAAKEESSETEPKGDKKRERRRRARRRGRDQGGEESLEGEAASADEASEQSEGETSAESKVESPAAPVRNLAPARIFPAPTTLISDTLQRYRQDESFKEAFYPPKKEEEAGEQSFSPEKEKEDLHQDEDQISPSLPEESFAPESLWDFADEIETSEEVETPIEQEPK